MVDTGEDEAKKLYKTYLEFYKKEPNLKRDNIRLLTIEFQSMVYMLHEYNIILGDYGFIKYGYRDMNLPMSRNVQSIITGFIAGKDKETFESYELDSNYKKIVGIIGEAVMDEIKNEKYPDEKLKDLALISYFRNHIKPNRTDAEIKKMAYCSDEEIQSVNNINNKIVNNDFYKKIASDNSNYINVKKYTLKINNN